MQAGTAVQVHAAWPTAPPQGLPAVQVAVVVAVTQPPAVNEHVTTVFPMQTVPLVNPAHTAGAAGHAQAAEPGRPMHCCPPVHVSVAPRVTHMAASRLQWMTCAVPMHTVPVTPMHAAGGLVQEQVALGCVPVQGLLFGQVTGAAFVMQLSPSATQVSSVVVAEQKAPTPFSQPAGGALHLHVALGAVPAHVACVPQALPASQVVQVPEATQVCSRPPGVAQRVSPTLQGGLHPAAPPVPLPVPPSVGAAPPLPAPPPVPAPPVPITAPPPLPVAPPVPRASVVASIAAPPS